MNRIEFMNHLAQLLQGMPEEERQDALRYYEDYFEDAGSQREQDVIRELGSPSQVANKIWEGMKQNQSWDSQSYEDTHSSKEYNYGSYDSYNNSGANQSEGTNYNSYNYDPCEKKEKKEKNWILIALLIVTIPFTLPIICAVFGGIISLFFGTFGCMIGFFFGGIGVIIAAVTLFAMGLTGFGFFCLGIAFSMLMVSFLLMPLMGWICKSVIPSLYRLIRDGITKFLGKGGVTL